MNKKGYSQFNCFSLGLPCLKLTNIESEKFTFKSILFLGGSVTAGLGIYDTMQYISAPVATWCIGQVFHSLFFFLN